MGIREYETESDLDTEFERIMEINQEHQNLKNLIKESLSDLISAKEEVIELNATFNDLNRELATFEEKNAEHLID